MWSVSNFWRARTTLMRRTLLDNTSRWTLSFPSFNLVLGALGEFERCAFDPNFPGSRGIDLLGQESWDTQPSCMESFTIATDPFAPPFFDFLLGFASASTCRKWHLSPNTHFSDLWLRHTGRCQNPHDGFLHRPNRYGISLVYRVFLFIAWPLWGFLLLAVSPFCLRMGCGRRRSPFPSLTTALVSRGLECHDWDYMSLLWNIVPVHSNENNLPLSS